MTEKNSLSDPDKSEKKGFLSGIIKTKKHADNDAAPLKTEEKLVTDNKSTTNKSTNQPHKFGFPGKPFDKNNPVRFGFLVTSGALAAFIIYTQLDKLTETIIWIVTAAFISLGMEPIVQKLTDKGLKRGLSLGIVLFGLLIAFSVFFSILVPTIVNQITQLVEHMPTYIQNMLNSSWFHNLDHRFSIRQNIENNAEKLIKEFTSSASSLAGTLIGAGTAVSHVLLSTFMILIFTVYFLISMPAFKAFMYRIAPASRRERFKVLSEEVIQGVGGYVTGQATIAIINAAIAGTLMTILNIPFRALLISLVAIFAFIPLIGPTIALITVTSIALTVGWQTALIYAICYLIYLQIEGYVLSPIVMKKAVEVPPVVSIVSIVIGGNLLGVLGAVIAIPTAAAAQLLFREVIIPRQDKQ
ncbi:MAG: AI-2E family transporter [Micrococcaceae bacterium]